MLLEVCCFCLFLCSCTALVQPDASTINGKVLWGYQGWFGPSPVVSPLYGYVHWSRDDSALNASNAALDAWPDFSGYKETALYPADPALRYPGGGRVSVYSSTAPGGNGSSISTHFQWMQEYKLDGVFLQRFVNEIEGFSGPRYLFRQAVMKEVADIAQETGRVWAVEWDITGANQTNIENTLSNDYAAHIEKYTSLPNYLHQEGKPIVAIFGMGFKGSAYPSDVTSAINTIRNLQKGYNLYVIGGVPYYWRTEDNDSRQGWLPVYNTFDALIPWSVGRYNSIDTFDALFSKQAQPDSTYCSHRNQGYGPVVWPGFSWANLKSDPSKFNQIPRNGGTFFNAQAHSIVQKLSPSATFIFGAMFDEWNESTAIAKLAKYKNNTPSTGLWLYANIDKGYGEIESDHYLKLAAALAQMFRSAKTRQIVASNTEKCTSA